MATWTDGAAYAPIERPDGFATPEVAPLDVRGPERQGTPGPMAPPASFAPSAPQVPLEHIRAIPPVTRNPVEPFSTTSMLLTSSPPGAPDRRDPLQPFQGPSGTTAELPPPSGDPLPPPSGHPLPPPSGNPLPPPSGAPAPTSSGIPLSPAPGSPVPQRPGLPFPPPGTPLPHQPGQEPLGPGQREELQSARSLLPLVVVGLVLAVAIPAARPWLVLVAGLLANRTRSFSGSLGTVAITAGVTMLVLVSLVSDLTLLSGLASFGLMIWSIVILVRVRRIP